MKRRITVYPDVHVKAEVQESNLHLSWKKFVKFITTREFHHGKGKAGKLCAGYYVRGKVVGQRNDKNLKQCCLALIDIDVEPYPSRKQVIKACKQTGLSCIAHTSHTEGRFRIIIVTNKAYNKEMAATVQYAAYEAFTDVGLNIPMVGEVKVKSIPWFLPSDGGRGDGWIQSFKGKPLKVPKHKIELSTNTDKSTEGGVDRSFDGTDPLGSSAEEFIEQLKSGTIHTVALKYMGQLRRLTNMTANQIYNNCTKLIDEHCADQKKIDRWHDGEGESAIEHVVESADTQLLEDDVEEVDFNSFIMEHKVEKKHTDGTGDSPILFEGICRKGQLNIFIAPPSSGKTSVMFFNVAAAIAESKKYDVVYIDVDSDVPSRPIMREFAEKHKFEYLNPYAQGDNGIENMTKGIKGLIKYGKRLDNKVFIVDTLKKFNDMMKKSGTKSIMKLFKGLCELGATVLILAHSNKRPESSGNLIYEGTNDIETECDCLIYIYNMKRGDHKVAAFYPDKTRGNFGRSSFCIPTRETRTVSNMDSIATLESEFTDVRFLLKPVKTIESMHISVGELNQKIDRIFVKKNATELNTTEIVAALKGTVGEKKIRSFLKTDGLEFYNMRVIDHNKYMYSRK